MEQLSNIKDNIKESTGNLADKIKESSNKLTENIKENLPTNPASSGMLSSIKEKTFINYSTDFLNSNTLVAKATFLLFVIIVFITLFFLISKILIFFLMPSNSPYIINGMKDGSTTVTIPQSLNKRHSVPIFRSKNEYDGIEFTYSVWIYVNDVDDSEDIKASHIFHKGSIKPDPKNQFMPGLHGPNISPGLYLYNGKFDIENDIQSHPVLSLLVRMNVFHTYDLEEPYYYYDDIHVEGIPIKKWVNIILRVTSQNIVDVYINGIVSKRHKLSNIIKQNYDNVYVNLNGGFDGNLSNLKYYNYAIGTYEIDKIISNGPNLKMAENSSLYKSKPNYLSSAWYFDSTDPL